MPRERKHLSNDRLCSSWTPPQLSTDRNSSMVKLFDLLKSFGENEGMLEQQIADSQRFTNNCLDYFIKSQRTTVPRCFQISSLPRMESRSLLYRRTSVMQPLSLHVHCGDGHIGSKRVFANSDWSEHQEA